MKHFLNLLTAIALLVWDTNLVRTGILRVLGANLRTILAPADRPELFLGESLSRVFCNSERVLHRERAIHQHRHFVHRADFLNRVFEF